MTWQVAAAGVALVALPIAACGSGVSVKASVTACSGETWTDEGGNAYTLETATSVPAVGDDSVSWRVTIELNGGRGTATSTICPRSPQRPW